MSDTAQENCKRCGDFFAPVTELNEANPGLCGDCHGTYDQAWLGRVNRGFGLWIGALTGWIAGWGLLIDNRLLDGFVMAIKAQSYVDFRLLFLIILVSPPLIFTIACVIQWRKAQREHEKIHKGPMKRRWMAIIGKRMLVAFLASALVLSGWLIPALRPYWNTRTAFNLGWLGVLVLGVWLLRPVSFAKAAKLESAG